MAAHHSKKTWDKARTLFIQGFGYTDIADETGILVGTIKNRIHREKWVELRDEIKVTANQAVKHVAIKDLKTLARDLKDKLARDAERTMNALERHDPAKLKLDALEQRERIVSSLQKRTWTTLGLDQPIVNHVVDVRLMSQLASTLNDSPSQVIECQPVAPQIESASPGDTQQNRYCANLPSGECEQTQVVDSQ